MTQGVNLMRPAEPEVTQGVNQMKTQGPGMTQGMPRDSPDKETSERRCSPCPQLTSQIRPRGPRAVNQGLLCPAKNAMKGAWQ